MAGQRSDLSVSAYAIPGRLRAARARAGWTRKELASKSGVTSFNIQKYEDGLATPGAENLRRLCKALRVSADWIVDVSGWDAHKMIGPEGDSLVELFRKLPSDDRQTVVDLAKSLADRREPREAEL